MIPSNQLHNHSDTAALSHDSLDSWIYSLFSSSSDAIIACDLNGAICAWNQGAQQIFGIHPKQSLGKDLNRLFLSSISRNTTTAAVTATAAPVPTPASASIPSDSDLYPSTLEQIRLLKGSSIKRVVCRIVKDQTQHQFLESISAVYEQQSAAVADRNGCSNGSINGSINSHTESNGRHSHTKDDLAASTTPVLVGYSVILTDLSTLPTLPVSPISPLCRPQLTLSPPATNSASSSPPDIAETAPAIVESTAPSSSISLSLSEPSSTGTVHQTLASEEHDRDASFNFPDIASRRTAFQEYWTDSGFDERSPAAVAAGPSTLPLSNGGSTAHVPPLDLPSQDTGLSISNSSSEPVVMSAAPSLLDLIPGNNNLTSAVPLPTSRGNSICFPDSSQERVSSGRPTARATSMGHLLSMSSLDAAVAIKPRALSIATTAISYTSSGTQLCVSMSSSPDKSRLDIHHNPLSLSNGVHHPTSHLAVASKQEREWDDPYFTYLAPIAANLLSCHGEHFFDVVVEELAIQLGVKYAFISQLVSLDELKELDPTEYMNLIEQFDGVVPQIDGVMHNISSWPGGSHINPHAFQGYLADCTIQDKFTFLEANLADNHQDVAECLMDQTIQSYIGMRLETAQGEIVGVIGIIHDKPLTEEDGDIVKMVLSHVGASVANELDRLRVETNLIGARDVAESIAKNKTKFLADMSHEIRQVGRSRH
ncbi:hypothetical protein EDD21DRAFT_420304 [Dissophora ornata]|nr:hypothetical protein EDD21DRAFT_420304 [Dissophora ornata]